jgi:hypothetical protein
MYPMQLSGLHAHTIQPDILKVKQDSTTMPREAFLVETFNLEKKQPKVTDQRTSVRLTNFAIIFNQRITRVSYILKF